jgi:hypothetical protein
MMSGIAALMLVQTPTARAHDDDGPVSVTVSFGAGLNTAAPGNHANHKVLPKTIHVRAGGVVNFVVAGFYWIWAYNPGKRVSDVLVLDPSATFINDTAGLYFQGVSPLPPPPGVTLPTSNAFNRVESISFATPGRYLVICNVTGHFLDGMYRGLW